MGVSIRPCPACGAVKPAFVREQGRYPAKGQMVCHRCGARGPLAWTLEEAREGWDAMPRDEHDDVCRLGQQR